MFDPDPKGYRMQSQISNKNKAFRIHNTALFPPFIMNNLGEILQLLGFRLSIWVLLQLSENIMNESSVVVLYIIQY